MNGAPRPRPAPLLPSLSALDIEEAAIRVARLADLLAGADALLAPHAGERAQTGERTHTARAVVAEARALASLVREQLDAAATLEHEQTRSRTRAP